MSHKIDPDNPPDHIQKILQPPLDPDGITRDTETGRRLYPCTYEGCSFVAKNVTFLRYHLPSHTGERVGNFETIYCLHFADFFEAFQVLSQLNTYQKWFETSRDTIEFNLGVHFILTDVPIWFLDVLLSGMWKDF